jgi:cytochrome c biogenesis protein CcdA
LRTRTINYCSRIWQGIFLLPAILFFAFSVAASPVLTWEAEKQQSPLTTRLSAETLQHLINRIIMSPDVSSEILAFGLRNTVNEITVENILQKLNKMPEPVTIAELAARLQLRLVIDRAKPHIQLIRAIKYDVRALEKAWDSYSHGPTLLAEDAAMTARALLDAGQTTDSQTTMVGIAVLKFIELQLMGTQGAWHRFDPETGKAAMDGQLSDNAALGLAFYEGYKVTDDHRWLDNARQLAGLIFDRLYDRKLGGFFFRNSTSSQFYNLRELFVADKPLRLNGMASLLLYRVGKETGEIRYTEAATRSIAALQDRALEAPAADITAIVTTYQALLENKRDEAPAAQSLQNTGFGIIVVLSFIAGVLGFLSPCTLPILPAYFAFASQSGRKNILLMTIAFFSGLALIFSLMGATATMLGTLVSQYHEFLLRAGGFLIILFGLTSLMGKGFSGAGFQRRPRLSLAGSFFFGMTFSVGWTACIGPILGAMLVLAATAKTAWAGAASLFVFALGLSLPLMIFSLYLGRLDRNGRFGAFWQEKDGRAGLPDIPFISTLQVSSRA